MMKQAPCVIDVHVKVCTHGCTPERERPDKQNCHLQCQCGFDLVFVIILSVS